MAKLPLTTGSYEAKALIAAAQRCVNLYGEKNPEDSPFPYTYYPTPGLTLLTTVEPTFEGGWRGLYFASNSKLYGVCGGTVYHIDDTWTANALGEIPSVTGAVSITDNGNYLVIVDGSNSGWTVKLSDDTFFPLISAGFVGGSNVALIDGYLILNIADTVQWYISASNEITFDPTMFASKSGFSDLLVGVAAAKRYIYLFGKATTEVWFDAGDTPFPFNRLPGVFMQYGCASPASIAQMDGDLYWLAQTPQGNAFVCKTAQFNAEHISTFALDNILQTYPDLDQAIGFTYELEGHFFYVLSFPESDVTWQYDLSTHQWTQLAWIDDNGVLHRHRANCFASAYGQPVVGDWETGKLYLWDQNNFTDDGRPIARIRSFAHGVDDASNRIHYTEFIGNFEVGNGGGSVPVPVSLRWSDTRGVSWSNAVMRSLGREGEYVKSVQWRRLGMARDRVFELSWSAPCKTALMGAWVDAMANNQ